MKHTSKICIQKLDGELKRLVLVRSKFDTCVYYRIENGTILIVSLHVDELLIFLNHHLWVNELTKQRVVKFLIKGFRLVHKVHAIRVTHQKDNVCLDQQRRRLFSSSDSGGLQPKADDADESEHHRRTKTDAESSILWVDG